MIAAVKSVPYTSGLMAPISIATIELRMGKTLPETIVTRLANYLSWRLLINENHDMTDDIPQGRKSGIYQTKCRNCEEIYM